MGIFDFLGVGTAAAAPIEAIGNVIGKVYTTEGEKLSAQEMMERIAQNPQKWTALLNAINAKDMRQFNSGWRPFIGWICGVCVGLYYVPQFVLAAYLWFIMCLAQNKILPYPIDPTSLMQLVYLMLGFGAYRMVEKVTGRRK